MRGLLTRLSQHSEAVLKSRPQPDSAALAKRVYQTRQRSLVPAVALFPAIVGCLFLSGGMGLISVGSAPQGIHPAIERVSPDGAETIWENQITPPNGHEFHLTLDLDNRLSAVDTWSRRVLWQHVMPAISSTSAPLAFADRSGVLVGVATTIGAVYLINAASGNVVWMQNVSDRIDVSPLQIKNSILTVACADGRIYGLNITDGHIDYMVQTDSTITALEPVSDERGEHIYAIADKTRILALNAMTGDLAWRVDTHGEATDSPLLTSNRVIAPTTDGASSKLWAFDTVGNLRWMSTFDRVNSFASANDYIAMAQGNLITLLRAETGEAVHYWQLNESPGALQLITQRGKLVVKTEHGDLFSAIN